MFSFNLQYNLYKPEQSTIETEVTVLEHCASSTIPPVVSSLSSRAVKNWTLSTVHSRKETLLHTVNSSKKAVPRRLRLEAKLHLVPHTSPSSLRSRNHRRRNRRTRTLCHNSLEHLNLLDRFFPPLPSCHTFFCWFSRVMNVYFFIF